MYNINTEHLIKDALNPLKHYQDQIKTSINFKVDYYTLTNKNKNKTLNYKIIVTQ